MKHIRIRWQALACCAVGLLMAGLSGCSSDPETIKIPKAQELLAPKAYYGVTSIVVPTSVSAVTVKSGSAARIVEIGDGIDLGNGFKMVSVKVSAPEKTHYTISYYPLAGFTASTAETKSGEEVLTRAGEAQSDSEEVDAAEGVTDNTVTEGSDFGTKTFVPVPITYAFDDYKTNWPSPIQHEDVVVYDETHNHYLRYKFAHLGPNDYGYYLTDAYDFSQQQNQKWVATLKKDYTYCEDCASCTQCMPWGCSCGCGKTNPYFKANGDTPQTVTEIPDIEALPYSEATFAKEDIASFSEDEDYSLYHNHASVFAYGDLDHAFDYSDLQHVNGAVLDYDIEARLPKTDALEAGKYPYVRIVLELRATGESKIDKAWITLKGLSKELIAPEDDTYIRIGNTMFNQHDDASKAQFGIKGETIHDDGSVTVKFTNLRWLSTDALTYEYSPKSNPDTKMMFNIVPTAADGKRFQPFYNVYATRDENGQWTDISTVAGGDKPELVVELRPKDVTEENLGEWNAKLKDIICDMSNIEVKVRNSDNWIYGNYVYAPVGQKQPKYPYNITDAYPNFGKTEDWYTTANGNAILKW